jgi:hypothetical protein
VTAPDSLDILWECIAPHIPVVEKGTLPRRLPEETLHEAAIPLLGKASVADVRRWLNAHVHCLHLMHNTLALHGVAFERHGQALLLLGGHGAGKSLVGLALARHGWSVLAGDVALVDLSEGSDQTRSGQPVLLGGSAAYLARPAETLRCFPDLPIVDTGQDRVELQHLLPVQSYVSGHALRWPLKTLVLIVGVNIDPCAEEASLSETPDVQTTTTQLYRASGHLLDRILENSDYPLRQLETNTLAYQRVKLTRQLAASLPMWVAYGAPRRLATMIEDIT